MNEGHSNHYVSFFFFLSFLALRATCVREDDRDKTLMSEEPGMRTDWIDTPTKCTDNSRHPLTTPSV